MKNLQFDTFLCKIHGIVAEIYANTPDIALARFIFPPPFVECKKSQKQNSPCLNSTLQDICKIIGSV